MATSTSSTTGPRKTSSKDEAKAGDKQADLLKRTNSFAKNVRTFVRKTPRTITSLGDCRQLVKTSGAIGASYIAADHAASRDLFLGRISDCRRDAKQSTHWLQLLDDNLEEKSEDMRTNLLKEAGELERIFGAIVGKVLNKAKASQKEESPSA